MNTRYCKIGVAVIALLFVVGMVGCKYTGGGTIDSAACGDDENLKATFAFVFDACGLCEGDVPKGNLLYHDQYWHKFKQSDCANGGEPNFDIDKAQAQGLKLKGDWTNEFFTIGDYAIAEFEYDSQNPFCKGEGEGTITVYDAGEGANMGPPGADLICVHIESGPFEHYNNCKFGIIADEFVSGNVQAHECPGADGIIPN